MARAACRLLATAALAAVIACGRTAPAPVAPDWEFYGAQYDRFVYEAPSWLEGHTLTELALVAANAPSRPQRYHYRYLAADLAQQAADLLPHHTQAYVATLCWAARHLRNFDQGRVERLYARALRGTPSIYDMDFPNACPLPDFDRARQTPPPPPRRTAIQVMLGDGHHARRDAIALLALLAVGLLMPLGLALPRRRWRRFTPRP